MPNLPKVSSSKKHFKSVLYSYWKATVNKKVAKGKALYLLRGCSICFAQCGNNGLIIVMYTSYETYKNIPKHHSVNLSEIYFCKVFIGIRLMYQKQLKWVYDCCDLSGNYQ